MSEATQALQDQLKAEKELVELAEAAQRLSKNVDFRRLIHDEYLLKEPARLAMAAGDPTFDPQQRADCAQMSLAAGHFKRFLSVTFQRGQVAQANIIEIEGNLDELRAMEAGE